MALDYEFKDELDTSTASLWSTPDSSSLGFHDDHWGHSFGGDGCDGGGSGESDRARSSSGSSQCDNNNTTALGVLTNEMSPGAQSNKSLALSPDRLLKGSQSLTNLNASDAVAVRMNYGRVTTEYELPSPPPGQPKLIFSISYKNVKSRDPTGIMTFNVVPIDVEFKNEHKLFITQWGVHPKESRNTTSLQYHPIKMGMVQYSLCCDEAAVINSYDDVSPWCVTSRRGEYYVTDLRGTSRTMRKYLEDGTLSESWTQHIFNTPRGIATSGADDDRVIYVSDTHHRVIYVCAATGDGVHTERVQALGHTGKLRRFKSESNLNATAVSYSDTQFINPLFIASDSRGNIIVSDAGDHSVKVYSAHSGQMSMKIDDTRPGDRLDTPMGVCTDLIDNIYVADYGKHRVAKFNRYGLYLGDVVSHTKGGVYHPRGVDVYSNYIAVTCHNSDLQPVVKVFEIGQQLARQTEKACDCSWLRLSHEN